MSTTTTTVQQQSPTKTSLELAKKRSKFKRKALIVGVNEYDNPTNNLRGCVNDAKDVGNTLLICGFPPTRIKYLLDKNATKDKVLKGLEWLVKDAKEGDVLIFYFSGHGSYVTDTDGDELSDRVDEVILPSDFSFQKKTYITDDELNAIFTGKVPKGARAEVILDTCHSGTGTRSLMHLGNDMTTTARFVPPPEDVITRVNSMIPEETTIEYIGEKAVEAKTQHNILWAACADYQVAWELQVGDQIRGAFTHSLMQIIRRSNGNKRRRLVYQLLRTHMFNSRYQQTPQLETSVDETKEQYFARREFEDDISEVAEE